MLRKIVLICTVVFGMFSLSDNAEARKIKRLPNSHAIIVCDERGCSDRANFATSTDSMTQTSSKKTVSSYIPVSNETTYLDHPAGCLRRAFCGCGAATRVFGRPVRELWLAANWYKFSRTSPSSGMVGVRPHHVFVLEHHIQGDVWMVTDHNSGGRRSRQHARSIAGYTIVDPHSKNI